VFKKLLQLLFGETIEQERQESCSVQSAPARFHAPALPDPVVRVELDPHKRKVRQ
jgi:hypothetical protein